MENENTVSTSNIEIPTTETTSTNIAGDNWTPESTETLGHDESKLYDENGDEINFDNIENEEEKKQELTNEEKPKEEIVEPQFDKTKFDEMSKEYNEMKTFFENVQRNPEVLKQLYENFSKQNNTNSQNTNIQQQNLNSNLEFNDLTEEQLENPAVFAKEISNRMQAQFTKNLEPIIQFTNYMSQYMPYIQNLVQSNAINGVNKIINDFGEKYGDEAKPYLKEGTKEFDAITSKIKNNPQLSLEEAFLLVKPQFINKQVDAKVSEALAKKRTQSLTLPSSRSANAVSNKPMSLQEAITAAMKQ